jgi:hypothetical protein
MTKRKYQNVGVLTRMKCTGNLDQLRRYNVYIDIGSDNGVAQPE